jgi:hypothetical protein
VKNTRKINIKMCINNNGTKRNAFFSMSAASLSISIIKDFQCDVRMHLMNNYASREDAFNNQNNNNNNNISK